MPSGRFGPAYSRVMAHGLPMAAVPAAAWVLVPAIANF
jgi:hypothetical protein